LPVLSHITCLNYRFGDPRTHPLGSIYLIGRYYDPAIGQFLSVDPEVQQTEQAYLYVGDDPVNAIDPHGNPCRLPCARPGKRDPSRTRQHRSQTIDCECANSIGHFLQHSSES
jgi:RHS repeat-associated protein